MTGVDDSPAGVVPASPTGSWRDRAVERSLREARARAQGRSDRFVVAAQQLLEETGSLDFTVQQLVERTGMSLRSFYQHFGSKDELLLVLFHEGVRGWVEAWRARRTSAGDPVEELQALVRVLHVAGHERAGRPRATATRVLVLHHLQLVGQRPDHFSSALAPLRELLVEILTSGVVVGRVRPDLPPSALAVLVLQTLVTATILCLLTDHLLTTPLDLEHLWAFLRPALLQEKGPSGLYLPELSSH